jgi:hypothetical protein
MVQPFELQVPASSAAVLPQLALDDGGAAAAVAADLFAAEVYPVVSLLNITWMWVLTAEIVAAMSQQGAMPAMYQSIQNLGSTDRNARVRDASAPSGWSMTHDVPPIPAGVLGREYLTALLRSLSTLATVESPTVEAAARHCLATVETGGRVFPFLISHFPPHQSGAPGDLAEG